MHPLTNLIREELKPALGVTESGSIALAAARAAELVHGPVTEIDVTMSSGIYKNSATCGVPGGREGRACPADGAAFAAALGALAGDPEKGLEALSGAQPEDRAAAAALVAGGKVHLHLSGMDSRIYLRVKVSTAQDHAAVTIRDSHTGIVKIEADDRILLTNSPDTVPEAGSSSEDILNFSLAEQIRWVREVDVEELRFLHQAHEMNLALFEEGRQSDRTVFLPRLLEENGGIVFSRDPRATAMLLCVGAIEARVLGLNRPAMSITGSGAHGIIATLPLYALAAVRGLEEEALLRATALSMLVCMTIKARSGRLSAFCGCAIAAGTGAGCGLAFLQGGDTSVLEGVIRNFAAGITGMICDGGNPGCCMKAVTAVDSAFRAADLALHGVSIDARHGICAGTPEETMRNMGWIASPGMTGTEEVILRILEEKQRGVCL